MEKRKFSVLFDEEEEGIINPFSAGNNTSSPDQTDSSQADSTQTSDQIEQTSSVETPTASPTAQNGQEQQNQQPHNQQEPQEESNPSELLVCAGATCVCDKAVSPQPVELQVVSHQKYFINDQKGAEKFVATTKENNILSLNFKQCKVPNPNKPDPCQPKLQWKDFYEGVELPGKAHVLTEKSTAMCTAKGGKITIKTTGQQQQVTPQQVAAAQTNTWAAINPLLAQEPVSSEQQDQDALDEAGIQVTKIQALRPVLTTKQGKGLYSVGSKVTFEVVSYKTRPTAAQKQAINWVVYDSTAKPILNRSDIGPLLEATFSKPGEYIIKAYGKTPGAVSADGKDENKATTCRILIKENQLAGVKPVAGQTKVRISQALAFQVSTLFAEANVPLGGADQIHWQWVSYQRQGNQTGPVVALPDRGPTARVTFGQAGSYFVLATLGGITHRSPEIQVVKNRIVQVSATKTVCRVGEKVQFTVAEGFAINPPLPEEAAQVKWAIRQADQPVEVVAEGRSSITLTFEQAATYTVYAYLHNRSEQVCAQITVQQPELVSYGWQDTQQHSKSRTGWEEKSIISLHFRACEGIRVDLELYVGKENDPRNRQLLEAYRDVRIPADNTLTQAFVLGQEKYREQFKKAALGQPPQSSYQVYFLLKSKTPGCSIQVKKEATLGNSSIRSAATNPFLLLDTKQKITKICFYKDNKLVNHAYYEQELTCRVYARNLVGKQVQVELYRIETFLGQDALWPDKRIISKACVITEAGYGAFTFRVPTGEDTHYLRAKVLLEEQVFEVGQAQMTLKLIEKPKRQTTAPSPVAIEKTGSKDKKETCPRCEADLTKEDLVKMFPNLKSDKDLFALTRKRYKDEFKSPLPDYTLDDLVIELNKTFEEFEINTCRRKAYFLAQVAIETGDFRDMSENIGKEKADQKYGDFKFRGRGLIQLTFKNGYERFGAFAGEDFVEEPDKMLQSLATIVRSAGWFWQHGKLVSSGAELPLNPKADIGDFKRICELVHGDASTFQKRKEKLEEIKPGIYDTNAHCKADKSITEPIIDFHIYQEGKIEKLVPKEKTYMARYYYHDKDGVEHYLGSADFHTVDWRASTSTEKKKDKDGKYVDYAELIDFRSLRSYSSGNVKFKFIPGSLGRDNRYYVDIDAFACIIGAMIEESIEDLGFNGFSKIDGDTGGGSVSHKNGMIGDLRYLNKKKNATATWVSISKTNKVINPDFDYERQERFNNSLYKFGYSRYELVKMLSNTFTKDGSSIELPYTESNADHYDHLHIQGLKLSSVLTIKEK